MRPVLSFGAVLVALACGKPEAQKSPAPSPPPDTAPAEPAGDLEEAIARARTEGGTVTALGADGKQRALPIGRSTLERDPSFEVTLDRPPRVAAGSAATLSLGVAPGTGFKLNEDFPTVITVKAPPGVTLSRAEMRRGDATAFGAVGAAFPIEFTPSSAGEAHFTAELSFAVCTETTCDPKKSVVTFAVAVE